MERIVYTYDKTHDEICRIINDATEYVFWFAFYLDFEYNPYIKRATISALERGIKVYINTSEINTDPITYTHPNLIVQNNTRLDKTDDALFRMIMSLTSAKSHKYVNHMRFIYNGNELLMGGANSNARYNGNLIHRTRNIGDDEFYWHDFGYLTDKYPNQFDFFYTIFSCLTDKTTRELSIDNLIISNKTHYDFILTNIRNSKQYIYIECQYFHTHTKYGNNQIAFELAARINRAIRNNEEFKLVITTNSLNHDERAIHYMSTFTSIGCLCDFRKLFDCDDNTFAKYVICRMPTISSHIVVHSKCWIFDDNNALYTTGNLSDRSYYDTGDLEMGIIIHENISEFRKTIEANLTNVPLFDYDFKFPKYNTGTYMLDNIQQTKDIWCYFLDTVNPYIDIETAASFKFSP
jgi:phosphatidylserine/phosphatidylglycerophosphate/cardiolipin synthase-like enzyme